MKTRIKIYINITDQFIFYPNFEKSQKTYLKKGEINT